MKNRQDVIVLKTIIAVFILIIGTGSIIAESQVERQVDSLFKIASSGQLKYRDQVEPAKEAIAAIGVQTVPFLIDKFTTKSARERWSIINILTKIGSPAVPDLVSSLGLDDGLVVQRVCWALGDIKDTSAVLPLISIANHMRWQVREQAIGALGKIADYRGAETVSTALSDSIGQVRKAAAVAVGKLKIKESAKKLIHLFGDDFYGARLASIESILLLENNSLLEIIKDSIESKNSLVGNLACHILGTIATDPAKEILLQQTKSENPDRRAHAAVALIKADPLDNCLFRRFFIPNETDRLVLLKINSAIQSVSDE